MQSGIITRLDVNRSGAANLRVEAKTVRAEGVHSLTLVDPAGGRLPDWTPGSHIDLMLPGELTRQYSLCGRRWDSSRYEVAVLREPASRGGSHYIHDTLQVGDLVGVGGPRNNFQLVPADRYLFIAGGIGITPLLPMIAQVDLLGAQWSLLYGGRTRASMAFADDLLAWGDRVMLVPQDECGLLDLASAINAQPAGTKVYCCGPPPLIAAVEQACAHLPTGHLRIERFTGREQGPPVRSEPFEVVLERSRVVVTVGNDESVLDAVTAAGVNILSSCGQGICGTCETGVLGGVPDHRDSLLDESERAAGRSMFVCVSRSCSDRLVLDL